MENLGFFLAVVSNPDHPLVTNVFSELLTTFLNPDFKDLGPADCDVNTFSRSNAVLNSCFYFIKSLKNALYYLLAFNPDLIGVLL